MKSNKPSRKNLDQVLRESSVDPRTPGPLQVILDVNNPTYFRQRAMELIHESIQTNQEKPLTTAITLLAYAKHLMREPQPKPVKPKKQKEAKPKPAQEIQVDREQFMKP